MFCFDNKQIEIGFRDVRLKEHSVVSNLEIKFEYKQPEVQFNYTELKNSAEYLAANESTRSQLELDYQNKERSEAADTYFWDVEASKSKIKFIATSFDFTPDSWGQEIVAMDYAVEWLDDFHTLEVLPATLVEKGEASTQTVVYISNYPKTIYRKDYRDSYVFNRLE